MKRFISIAILSLIMNIQFIEYAQAVPGGAFRNFFKLFKGSGDDIIKKADDLIKNGTGQGNKIIRSEDDLLKNLEIERGYKAAGPKQEPLVLEKVGVDSHLTEFRNLKESSRTSYIKKLRKKKTKLDPKDLLEDDLLEISDNDTSSNNSTFIKYIIANWVGKIYRTSEYYNKPNYEDKMLLVCSNIDQVFYFSLLMEKEPKRAFLVDHKKFKNKGSVLPIQELVIIEDNDDVKIMSTMPANNNKWPSHYFTIYKDQNFYYDQSNSGYVTPEAIKNKVLNNPMGKNNCSKATNNGLL